MENNYAFAQNINGKNLNGIINLNTLEIMCYCTEEQSKPIIKALNENETLKDALFSIATGTQPYNEFEAFSFVETAKNIANKALNTN